MNSLTFNNTSFDVVDQNGQVWLRGYQIGSALGYIQPEAAISKLYERNKDEFTSEMTQIIKIKTKGGFQETRVFSPRGTHLLGMLASTKTAKEFRKWALDVLEAHCKRQSSTQGVLQLEEAKISLDQYVELDDLMYPKKKNASDNLPWHKLYDHFGVKSVREIPASRFKDVCDWINDLPTPHSQIKTTYFLPGKEGLDRNILSLIVYGNAVLKQLREALSGNPDIAREVQIPIWQTSALLNQEPFCNHNSINMKGTELVTA